jgi:hypothetical protein
MRLKSLLDRGLATTAALWPPICAAYRWIHRAAHVLDHPGRRRQGKMRQRYAGLLGALGRAVPGAGSMRNALKHFLKVTRSYWPGLFQCYDHADLPRTNNDLEQLFGSYRCHERRTTGRKVASPSTVVRGAARIVAATATRWRPVTGADLAPRDLEAWRRLRHDLDQRRHTRTLGRRFRQHPEPYLRSLERLLRAKSALPP